jgi:hypothetical protein
MAVCAMSIKSVDVLELVRLNDLAELIEKRGIDRGTAFSAVRSSDLDSKEKVASLLRSELKTLRHSKKASVRRVVIADLAMTMLENLVEGLNDRVWSSKLGIGEELLCLLRELLDVDRHRKSITLSEKLRHAAMRDGIAIQDGKEFLGVRELARRVGVRPGAIVEWRRSKIYHKEISRGLWMSPKEVAALLARRSKKKS